MKAKGCQTRLRLYLSDRSYDNTPLVNSGFSSTVAPWSSTGSLMSKTARREDAIKYNMLSLRYLAGQILGNSSMR